MRATDLFIEFFNNQYCGFINISGTETQTPANIPLEVEITQTRIRVTKWRTAIPGFIKICQTTHQNRHV